MTFYTLQTIDVPICRVLYIVASVGIIFLLSILSMYCRLEPQKTDVPFYGQVPNNPGAQKKKFITGSLKLLSGGYQKVCCCVHHAPYLPDFLPGCERRWSSLRLTNCLVPWRRISSFDQRRESVGHPAEIH